MNLHLFVCKYSYFICTFKIQKTQIKPNKEPVIFASGQQTHKTTLQISSKTHTYKNKKRKEKQTNIPITVPESPFDSYLRHVLCHE